MTSAGPHQNQPVYAAGTPLADATSAMILIHGRGATAQSILPLGQQFPIAGMAYLAPQARGNQWYPFSFLNPMTDNQPGIDSAMDMLATLVAQVIESGIPAEKIVIGGFSQGACVSAEFMARNAQRYGGLLVFSGGLIGPPGTARDYAGSLAGTPVFIGCSDVDFHIPVERVHETAAVLTKMGATVTKKIYPDMGHTIIQEELVQAQTVLNALATAPN